MRAVVFDGAGKEMRLENLPTPAPAADEVLLQVAACGLCRTDLHSLHGTPTFKKPPLVLGHEVSGTVAAVGERAGDWKEGERVLVPPVFSCGRCTYCLSGRSTLCTAPRCARASGSPCSVAGASGSRQCASRCSRERM